ncbi:ABC transporter substrate-binding protein [Amycolatopsis australiensis]|uniref:NitT/TauT family transport system substrate-binding protein n=1 Tax=Amycolatopsis australiensis TaxID=546364 RepID=A0A1K1LR27_9PSEU|nr:ABC transporter substrate-binding protein [Amycolatopsis australiensis]SFW13369.1 NitT/TauT family transport system substrate-binding protein [Amycolatopsis australiensis]
MRNAKRTALTTALAAALALTSSCSALGGDKPAAVAGSQLETSALTVSIISSVDLVPLWAAQDAGYFAAEGLNVKIDVADSGAKTMTKVVAGEAQLALTTWTLLFKAQSEGAADFRLVADATTATPKSNKIVTIPTSPVKHVEDLPGKKIAITSKNAASDVLTQSVMQDRGLDRSKVTWVPVPLPNMAAALQQGQVDAAYMPEPFVTDAAHAVGAIPIVDVGGTGSTQDFPLTGYATTAKWAQANPKTIAAFQRAIAKGTRDALNDRGLVERLVVKYAKVTETTAALMELPGYGAKLDARRLQRVPDTLLQLGIISSAVDASRMIVPQPTS